jgi:hypothetical protein
VFADVGPHGEPPEYERVVRGVAKAGYVCDLCGTEIRRGELCYASTIFVGGGSPPEWEPAYVAREPA